MTQAAQLAQYGANNVGLSFKNRIINGDMSIDQRNNGAAVTFPSGGLVSYTLDRWNGFKQLSTGGSFTVARSSVAPAGFTNSALVTITSAATDTGNNVNALTQFIEGFNTADLGWGTANAQAVTVSFWVRSSLTGTFSCAINNDGYDYSYVANYTISAANTWEQKTITIPGPTAGTWIGATNGVGLRLWFDLGTGTGRNGTANSWVASQIYRTAGSVQLLANNGATWQVTGVQLEKGTVATSFDYLDYGRELMLCQRYFYREVGATGEYSYFAVGGCYSSSAGRLFKQYPVTMRAVPTYSPSSGGYIDGVNFAVAFTLNLEYGTVNNARLGFTTASSFGVGQAVFLAQNTNANFSHSFNAEL